MLAILARDEWLSFPPLKMIQMILWFFDLFGIFLINETLQLGNKRNRNLSAETRNFPKPKFGSGFVPAHFQASWFQFRYLVLEFFDFLVNQEVLPWISGLTRNFLVKPRTSWFTQEILGESCEEIPPTKYLNIKCVFFLVIFRQFLLFLASVFFLHSPPANPQCL